jgi:uncharacterized membrane protein YbhN (UPF0104 family)
MAETTETPVKGNRALFWVCALVILAVLVWAFRGRIQFDWGSFAAQLKRASLGHVAAAVGLIWASFWVRSTRWMVFVSPVKKIGPFTTVGSHFIGFTAVGLFGRLADLTRPYLIARRLGLSIASQIAVYTIERMFDLGAAAILFSGALAFTPANVPHHQEFVKAGMVMLAGTAAMGLFAIAIRISGGVLAGAARGVFGRVSKGLGDGVAEKILGFREGLQAISSWREFVMALGLSLTMWTMIGWAYVETAHAFVDTPELAGLTFARTMLLMGASIGGSVLQLPVIGWFTQIAVLAAAMHAFFGAPVEAATACGAVLLVVLNLSIVPVGVVFAQVEKVSLRGVAKEAAVVETVEG